jgi:hypothetical protein
MDKEQLQILSEKAEAARKIREVYHFDFIQAYNSQISQLARQIIESLPKIDLSNFVRSIQLPIPKIDYSRLIPKTDYSQLIKNFQFQLPQVYSSLIDDIYRSQTLALQKFASDFARIHVPNLAKIRANAFLMTASLDSIRNIAELQNSFAIELASTIYRIIEENEDTINEFENLIETKLREQPNAKASLELIMFILTFLSLLVGTGQFYYAKLQYDDAKQSSQSNEQKFSDFIEILKRIAERLDEKPDEKDKTHYAVQRTVELKTKPKFNSSTIAVLYPNQQVKLVESSHKWIYVEYFDYLEGIPKYGWANKKYLVKIDKSK